MINTNSVKEALHVDIAISAPMAEALQSWVALYENRATWLNTDVRSLNLPSAIASEIARAVTIEMAVEISGSPRAKYLNAQFEVVLNKLRQQIEHGIALGGIMLKPYVSGKNISVDFVPADCFVPTAFDSNGGITACVFSDQRQVGEKFYTRLESHSMTPAGVKVINQAFRSSTKDALGYSVPLTELDAWKDLEPEATITGVDKPLFAYFRYPAANNVDPSSPLGVSCFARAVDLIEAADRQYSNLLWEMESGQRALYVDVLAFGQDANKKPILPNKRLYRTLESGSAEGDFFQEWSPTLREQNILNGLNAILRKIEFSCGIAYGTLSDPQTVALTATEIVISKQRTYATVVDCQKTLEVALEQLLWAMNVWCDLNKLAPAGKFESVYTFDDSIVVDRDMRFQNDLRLVTAGLMSKVEFRVRNFYESEKQAAKMIAAIPVEKPENFFGEGG